MCINYCRILLVRCLHGMCTLFVLRLYVLLAVCLAYVQSYVDYICTLFVFVLTVYSGCLMFVHSVIFRPRSSDGCIIFVLDMYGVFGFCGLLWAIYNLLVAIVCVRIIIVLD